MSAEGTITLSAPPGGTARLRILDLAGRVVRSFPEARIPAGARTYSWDRTDDTGGRVPGGTYWIAVTTAQGTEAAKIVVLE